MSEITNITKEGDLYEYDEVVTMKIQVDKKDLLAERKRLQKRIFEINNVLLEIDKLEK